MCLVRSALIASGIIAAVSISPARAAGVDPGPLRIAYAHLQAYQARRKREGGA